MQSGKAMLAQGLQIAAGVPLQCDEGADFQTFRIGLFGLDKLGQTERTVKPLEQSLRAIAQARAEAVAPAKAA
jgi:aspartate aminotransferase-like enzyme